MTNQRLAELVVVASWVDGFATLIHLNEGLITEANPFVSIMVSNPSEMLAVKLALTVLGVLLLARLNARKGLLFCLTLYCVVTAMHLLS